MEVNGKSKYEEIMLNGTPLECRRCKILKHVTWEWLGSQRLSTPKNNDQFSPKCEELNSNEVRNLRLSSLEKGRFILKPTNSVIEEL